MKRCFWISLFLFSFRIVQAQQDDCINYIRSTELIPTLRGYETTEDLYQNSIPNYLRKIKVHIHIVKNSDGTFPTGTLLITANSTRLAVDSLNKAFALNDMNLKFIVGDVDEILDSRYADFSISDNLPHTQETIELANLRNEKGVLHIFFVPRLRGASGLALDIPSKKIFLSNSIFLANQRDLLSVISHEVGHALGLFHTFQAWQSIDGSIIREHVVRDPEDPDFNATVAGVLDAMEIIGPDLTRFRLRNALELLGGASKKEAKEWEKLLAVIG